MNCIIPFEKRIAFNGPIKEICSISLEHEITQNDYEILGNFIISGTYKEHELSVNVSDFKYTIPFNVELTNKIEKESLEFSIDNFTYDIDNNDMVVKIDYILVADEIRESQESAQDLIQLLEEDFIESQAEITSVEDPIIEHAKTESVETKTEIEKEIEVNNRNTNQEIVSTIETENDYSTYCVHIVKDTDTIESLLLQYKITKEDLEKNNDLTTLIQGDKLLIPLTNE